MQAKDAHHSSLENARERRWADLEGVVSYGWQASERTRRQAKVDRRVAGIRALPRFAGRRTWTIAAFVSDNDRFPTARRTRA